MILMVNGAEQPVYAATDPLTRAVVISLFSWRRKDTDDDYDEPTGWWGDSYPTIQNDRIGSRLYLLRRRTLTSKTPIDAKSYIEQALAWMKEDGVAARIEVKTERRGNDKLFADIKIYQRDGSLHNLNFDDIWSELNG